MAYCGPTQLRSQAARANRSNHPPLRVVILVTSFDPSPTKKQKIPRLEIHGEDGDGRGRCVFWRGEAGSIGRRLLAVVAWFLPRFQQQGGGKMP